jgi:UDP-glucuronate 4-epimerase
MHVVSLLEREFGRAAIKEILSMRPGDVETTYADTAERERDIGFRSFRTIDDRIARFANGIGSITGSRTGRDE